jgi:hypothetical protein
MKKLTIALLSLLALLGIAIGFAASDWGFLQHWLAIHTGTVNEPGPYYGFWSGFGGDIGQITLLATVAVGVYHGVRKANCHEPGCWRIGRFPVPGTPHHLCAKHHPDLTHNKVTHEGIMRRHAEAKNNG